jgi:small subunit ribosomal protein S17
MADDNTIDDEVAAAPEAPAADAAVNEEPAAPAKRTRAKKAAEPVADEAAEPAAADEAPVAEEAGTGLPAEAPAAEEAPAEEAPAKPARAPRAKKAADDAVAADAPADEAPKKRTPRAKPLKKAARPKERKEHIRVPKPLKDMGRRKERRGIVVSAAMDKTITIRIDSAKPHPKYHKIVRRSTRLHAHDERNEAGIGDVVRIVETRPLSKLKRWRMVEIVEKAK